MDVGLFRPHHLASRNRSCSRNGDYDIGLREIVARNSPQLFLIPSGDILTTMSVSKSTLRPAFTPDERQREAIEHVDGPMLVVAGAGTGKTSVLTHRIERLVREGHARSAEILALTYTVNAAHAMRDRVRKLLGGKSVHTATFHDYCLDLLKRANQDFGVLDEQDLW